MDVEEVVKKQCCASRRGSNPLMVYQRRSQLSNTVDRIIGGPCRGRTYDPLIKSPAETLPQDTQQEESAAKGEDL